MHASVLLMTGEYLCKGISAKWAAMLRRGTDHGHLLPNDNLVA